MKIYNSYMQSGTNGYDLHFDNELIESNNIELNDIINCKLFTDKRLPDNEIAINPFTIYRGSPCDIVNNRNEISYGSYIDYNITSYKKLNDELLNNIENAIYEGLNELISINIIDNFKINDKKINYNDKSLLFKITYYKLNNKYNKNINIIYAY